MSVAAGAGRERLRGTRRGVLRAPVCGDRGHRPSDGLESAWLRRDAVCPAPHIRDRIFSPDLELCHQIKLSASRQWCLEGRGSGCPERGGPSGTPSRPMSPCWRHRSAADHWGSLTGSGSAHDSSLQWVVPPRGPGAQRPPGVPAGANQCPWQNQSQTMGRETSPASRPVPSSTLTVNSQQTLPRLWVVSKTINQEPSRLAPCQGGERG